MLPAYGAIFEQVVEPFITIYQSCWIESSHILTPIVHISLYIRLVFKRVPEALFLGGRQAEREPDRSLPPGAEVNNVWSYTSILHTSPWGDD